MKHILCFLDGHKWLYNFPSMPSKAICGRCKSKTKLNFKTLDWTSVDYFENETRSDEELIQKWV